MVPRLEQEMNRAVVEVLVGRTAQEVMVVRVHLQPWVAEEVEVTAEEMERIIRSQQGQQDLEQEREEREITEQPPAQLVEQVLTEEGAVVVVMMGERGVTEQRPAVEVAAENYQEEPAGQEK